MKVIRCINNNVAICLDSTGKEVVAFGKGIGFKKPTYDVELSQIDRVYYNIDNSYISMINELPEDIIEISSIIVEKARESINNLSNANVVITLADHIDFCIKRYKKGIDVNMSLALDVEQLYEKEWQVGLYGINLIKKRLGVNLPKKEAAYIALHILNAEGNENNSASDENTDIISKITRIVEQSFNIVVDERDFNYSRFVSHIHYLIKRSKKTTTLSTSNIKLFETVKQQYPKVYDCVCVIADLLKDSYHMTLSQEELLYLMLHVNRLCTREESD